MGTMIAIQVVWFLLFMYKLTDYSLGINIALKTLSLFVVLHIMGKNNNPASKLAWIIPVMAFPLLGGLLYLVLYQRKPARKLRHRMEASEARIRPMMKVQNGICEKVQDTDPAAAGQMRYIQNICHMSPHAETDTVYFSSGEEFLPVFLEKLKQAKHYIFMEYFIIHEGVMWNQILEVLKEKVSEGVDVRVIYDDVGSLTYLPPDYHDQLEATGILCEAFNPFVPFVSTIMNHRDHRKITVIDGYIGFTGGLNFGDEYINVTNRYGYWKDNAIMLTGEGVWNLNVMFLTMWNSIRRTDSSFEQYRPRVFHPEPFAGNGYVQPYHDTPLDDENVGENVYLNLINGSQHHLTILNPYVVLDNEMITALGLAAKRGVEVSLVVPGTSDSWLVSKLADTYYPQLMEQGVKIYRYQPGFIHEKVFVSDGNAATVGTFNLDYRSLYLHFECGVFLYRTDSVRQVEADAAQVLSQCEPLTMEMIEKGFFVGMLQRILRIFAPLI